ncbi:MAG: SAM-dependent chlorinase/fluorinase [Deltaproteobacteria bacterium]
MGSDNGSLSLIAERDGIEKVREIKNVDWIESKSLVSTFMGRDVYFQSNRHFLSPGLFQSHLFQQ